MIKLVPLYLQKVISSFQTYQLIVASFQVVDVEYDSVCGDENNRCQRDLRFLSLSPMLRTNKLDGLPLSRIFK
jgi:hypothetical protein